MEEPDINPKRKLVAINYCGKNIGNAEQACISAGYKKGYARGHAGQIVASSDVQEYIRYLSEITKKDDIATLEEIKEFWTSIMNNPNCKPNDRLRASELLAKTMGAFNTEW